MSSEDMSSRSMQFVDKYKYQIIVLIVIVILICCFFSPNTTYYTKNVYYEKFSPINNPGDATLQNEAQKYAEELANDTYIKVVNPCVLVSNGGPDVSSCVSNYKGYYVDILKPWIVDMFANLKRFNGEYVDEKSVLKLETPEQQRFARLISNAFASALDDTLNNGAINYDRFTRFDRDVFVPLFTEYLQISLNNALRKAYNVGVPLYDERSVVSTLPRNRPSTRNPPYNY